jgi:predicted lipid-binding transport protein (Tim44 family)
MSIPSRLPFKFLARSFVLALALAGAVPLATTAADARAGGGFSSGSRGSMTFGAPGFTRTAPTGGSAFQRSEAPQPGSGFNAAQGQPRRFGFGSGLAAGLLGAGLFGLLGGGQGFGLLPLLLIGGLIFFVFRAMRGRMSSLAGGPSLPGGAAFAGRSAMGRPMAGAGAGPGGRPATQPITIAPADFDAFESMLVDVQTAYGREDMSALARLGTPEMLRYFAADLQKNRERELHNDVGDAKLLQGDLAQAWREGSSDYATVAMRFNLRDLMMERASNRIVSGDPSRPSEVTELWTFRRDDRGPWRLSAIQQTA